MNKTFCKKSNFINFMFAGCLILFNIFFIGCGLDTFYVIDSPSVYHEPLYSSMELPERYFEFSTNEHDYEGTIKFLGTEVYYKIYNSSSKMNSEVSSINSAANNETSTNQSANRLIETYKYQTLRHSNDEGANILIPWNKNTNSRRVEIRLANDPEYDAEFTIANNTLGYPVRNILGNKVEDKSFSFKELSSANLPKGGDNGDADYEYSSTTEEIKEYYVSMFAVSVAQDDKYSSVYSTAIYLGSVTIPLE